MAAAYETGPRDRARLMERVRELVEPDARIGRAKGVDAAYFSGDTIASCFASGEWICWKAGGNTKRGWRLGGSGWVDRTATEIAVAMREVRGA